MSGLVTTPLNDGSYQNMDIMKRDERPPMGAWAPGGYLCTCQQCSSKFIGDKLAGTCADCAYKMNQLVTAKDINLAGAVQFVTAYPDTGMPIPQEIVDAAIKVNDFFYRQHSLQWQLLDICSRSYAYKVEELEGKLAGSQQALTDEGTERQMQEARVADLEKQIEKPDPYLADKPGFVLKPCPFCNSRDIEKAPRRDFPVATQCRGCGAEGPAKLTGREADTAWNNRKLDVRWEVVEGAVDRLAKELNEMKARMARLEAAGDKLASTALDADDDIREHLQVANYNLHGLLNTGERIDPPNPPQTIHQAGIDASVKVRHRLQEHVREWRKAKL